VSYGKFVGAALLLGALSGAQAAEGPPPPGEAVELAAARLQTPGDFGNYADNSRPRADAVVVPDGRSGGDVPANDAIVALTRSERTFKSGLNKVPSPKAFAWRQPPVHPDDHSLLLLGLGAAGLTAGAFLLGVGARRAAQSAAPRSTEMLSETPPLEKPRRLVRAPEPRIFEPPREIRQRLGIPKTPAVPERRPVDDTVPSARPRWWAITWKEQLAIDRWDRSIEKEFAVLVSLEDWLDAHAQELPGVNIDLLKAKLNREA